MNQTPLPSKLLFLLSGIQLQQHTMFLLLLQLRGLWHPLHTSQPLLLFVPKVARVVAVSHAAALPKPVLPPPTEKFVLVKGLVLLALLNVETTEESLMYIPVTPVDTTTKQTDVMVVVAEGHVEPTSVLQTLLVAAQMS